MPAEITFQVNGRSASVSSDPERTLLDVLREDLHLTGTKYGCGDARCGACTVLIDGKRAYACQTNIESVAGKRITTIEGLASGDTLHPVQEAFLAEQAFQCGYCTAGMILGAAALLQEKPSPTRDEIVTWMDRHVCRCGSYCNILAAVQRAAAAGRR
jgi:aerobic-type carbon monoxide dehydrogenase small subunit (CoxS/CutS family)